MSSTRTQLLAAVAVMEQAASALDSADERLCVSGDGTRARRAYRVAEPLTAKARTAGLGLAALLSSYRAGLLQVKQHAAEAPKARQALTAVVVGGAVEARAADAFRATVLAIWPAYVRLAADEDLWTTRSVSGWYRSQQEGAAAYAVQVDKHRRQLDAARRTMESAVHALAGPTSAQSRTLAAANTALRDS